MAEQEPFDLPAFEDILTDSRRPEKFTAAMTFSEMQLATDALRFIGENPNYDDSGRAGISLAGDLPGILSTEYPPTYSKSAIEGLWHFAVEVNVENAAGFYEAVEYLSTRPVQEN